MSKETGKRRMMRDGMSRRARIVWLAALFSCALSLRAYVALSSDSKPDRSDMAHYNEIALHGPIDGYRPPVYPLFLRAVYLATGSGNYRAAYLAQAVMNSLTVLISYWIVSRMAGARAALSAAAAFAFYPGFVAYTATLLTESLSVVFALLIIAGTLLSISDRKKAIAQAAVVGIGMLIKPAFFFFVPGMLLTTRKKALFLGALIIVLAPWTIYNVARSGRFVFLSDTGAINFYMSYNPRAKGDYVPVPEADGLAQRELYARAFDFIAHNKMKTADIIDIKIYKIMQADYDQVALTDVLQSEASVYAVIYAYAAILMLGCIGCVRLYGAAHRAAILPFVAYAACTVLFSIFQIRFRVMLEPLLIVYTVLLFARGSGGDDRAPASPAGMRQPF